MLDLPGLGDGRDHRGGAGAQPRARTPSRRHRNGLEIQAVIYQTIQGWG